MKKLVIILLMVLSSTSLGLGELVYKYRLFNIVGQQPDACGRHELGLFVQEELGSDWYYRSYTGIPICNFFTTEHFAVYRVIPRLDLGIGMSYDTNFSFPGQETLGVKVIGVIHLW